QTHSFPASVDVSSCLFVHLFSLNAYRSCCLASICPSSKTESRNWISRNTAEPSQREQEKLSIYIIGKTPTLTTKAERPKHPCLVLVIEWSQANR
ncbi:unnamed protein product, partial [Mycena citricolor]